MTPIRVTCIKHKRGPHKRGPHESRRLSNAIATVAEMDFATNSSPPTPLAQRRVSCMFSVHYGYCRYANAPRVTSCRGRIPALLYVLPSLCVAVFMSSCLYVLQQDSRLLLRRRIRKRRRYYRQFHNNFTHSDHTTRSYFQVVSTVVGRERGA